jgi:hypothetical protein
VKDANELLVAEGPEGFVRTWGRRVSEATARQRGAASEPPVPPTARPRSAGAVAPVLPASVPRSPEEPAAKEEKPDAAPQAVSPDLTHDSEGTYRLAFTSRTWHVKGLAAFGVDRLRVNVRVDPAGEICASRFHVDTFDLYSARSRQAFVEAAIKALHLAESDAAALAEEIALLIAALEKERLTLRQGKGEAAEPAVMSPSDREEALSFLRGDIVEALKADFLAMGCVGEETALLIGYFAMVSRKLPEPLSVLFCARSGAGKSTLQDRLCALCPPEDLVKYTRISGQVLFYKDENALRHKLLVVDEEDGAAQAAYALRSLLSSGYLSCSVTRTDPRTGRPEADDRKVNGPVSNFLTTAHPEAFDFETRNRYVLVTIDESREQTKRILERQRWNETLEGLMADERKKAIAKRHHDAQRLLEPLRVIIPVELTYPSGLLILRREHMKYLSLVKAITLLHQHQRPIRSAIIDGRTVSYIEATEKDVEIARPLAALVLSRNLDELSPPSRSLLLALQEIVERRKATAKAATGAKAADTKAADTKATDTKGADDAKGSPGSRRYLFRKPDAGDTRDERLLVSRQEIQKTTGLSYWHVRTYMAQLVEYEYVEKVRGQQGRQTLYELLHEEGEDGPGL